MLRAIAFRVARGLLYRTLWVLLYLCHLLLALLAAVLLFGIVDLIVEQDGGIFGRGPRPLTLSQRFDLVMIWAFFGLLSIAGSVRLRRCHLQFNTLYPEMQIGWRTARAIAAERALSDHAPASSSSMYDRDLDFRV